MGCQVFSCLDAIEPLTSDNREPQTEACSGRKSMVTGFNTDIKHEGVVFHVQTEPRKDGSLETAVYVRGAIIHSLKNSCQEFLNSPEYSDEKLKGMLEVQHRQVIARIRAGEIRPSAPPAAAN